MSPEQGRGELARLGPHSDTYSIGAMLYELVTGRTPFVQDGERVDQLEILMRLRAGPPRPAHELAPHAPAELLAIVEKSMAREIEDRYCDTMELAHDLRAFLERRVVRAYESGAWAEARKWVQRNKPLAGSLAAAVVAVAAGAVSFAVKAREAADARDELSAKNVDLVSTNRALGQARDEATQRANDVLSLSAQKDLDDLVAEAEKLWPAHPEMIPAYEDWLRRAKELTDGRPADESKGLKKRPSLAEHKAKLAELRADAKPLSEAEIQAERESHPKYAELQAKQAELLWRSRMLGDEPWPSDAAVEADLAKDDLPTDADALNSLAWPLVDPAKPVYGQEQLALLLARRAVAAATEEKRSGIRDTLAWALFKLGRLDEALSEARTALSEPGGDVLKSSAADLEKAVEGWRGGELVKRRDTRDRLAEEVVALTAQVNERRTYEFDDPEKEWWNRQLVKLVSDLEALRDPQTGLMSDVLEEPFGWGVTKRYEFAKSIGERSVDGPEAKRLWSEAIARIKASPKYGGLEIVPQMGLLPIGMDPNSQLWEFAHLQTGDPAVRGADGKLVLTEETGLVFVLIPGGKFWMGAQNKAGDRNHDPRASSNEGPVHEVELSTYLVSKYEMTQNQWAKINGVNPSYYTVATATRHGVRSKGHPVEQVSWTTSRQLMFRLALALPSEAQWEHAARGGTSTPWWTGEHPDELRNNVNIADASYVRSGGNPALATRIPGFDDGSAVHAASGAYPANPYGIHEVIGNVWEWCLDGFGNYDSVLLTDPIRPWVDAQWRVQRGGGFNDADSICRSTERRTTPPTYQANNVGLRPALRIAFNSSVSKESSDTDK